MGEQLVETNGLSKTYGAVTAVCGGEACHAGGWTGP